MKYEIQKEFDEHINVVNSCGRLLKDIELTTSLCIDSINIGGKIILFGNGGSAADAQHIAAELVGRYKRERNALPAISLTTDSSALTCIANDYNYDQVFSRQVYALANKEDTVIGISTGGTSKNVIEGIKAAKKIGSRVIGFSGKGGGDFNNLCDINLVVPSDITARVQEMHILFGHIICELIDQRFTQN